MKVDDEAKRTLADGFADIAKQFSVPSPFSDELLHEAEQAAKASADGLMSWQRENRRQVHLPFVTLDPATSTDLDQAFALEWDRNAIVLHYALADVAAFVPYGSLLEQEAWRRGLTIYSLDRKVPLYPSVISQRIASLLPDGPRPAYLVTISIDDSGSTELRSVERVICSSHAKLAYESLDVGSIRYLEPFAKRVWKNEIERGAIRVEFPQQEVVADPMAPGGVRLHLKPRLYSEQVNATLSLAVNLAIGSLFHKSREGLFRVMDEPIPSSIVRLRRIAHALGIVWDEGKSLRELHQRLDPNNGTHQRFLLDARRAGGRAKYAIFDESSPPWHSAIAGVYSHATAPMRRLADRYVLELALLLAHGNRVPMDLQDRIVRLPAVMDRSEAKAANIDRAVIDLLEAVSLQNRIGDILEAEVVDAANGIVQTMDPPIRSRASLLNGKSNGDRVQVRIQSANPESRKVELAAIEE